MFHYVNAITNTKGDALIGYYVKLHNAAGDVVSLYADENSTAIESVSGIANAAKVDSNGNADFYVADGEYTIVIYATDGTTEVDRYSDIPMAKIGMLQAASIAELAELDTQYPAILTLSGSQGVFIFDSSDLSAAIAADTGQSTYVAPSSDDTGESGAWVRMGSVGEVAADGILSGCGVTYVGNLDFEMGAGTYRLNGIIYEADAQDVSLSAAHATLDRIDILYLDTDGVLNVLAGTAAANPSRPSLDPSSQLEVTFVLVPAAATDLDDDITNEDIYLEGTQWPETSSDASIVIDSTNNPYAGTKCVEATNAPAGAYVKFVRASAMSFDGDGSLVFRLRNKGGWSTTQGLLFQWYNGGVAVGSGVNLGFNNPFGFASSEITEHQLVIINKALFSVPVGAEIDELRITVVGATMLGWNLDNVILQNTGDTILPFYPTGLTLAQTDARYFRSFGITASKLLGRGDSGAGLMQEITLGTGLSMSGTTINAAAGSGYTDEQVRDVVAAMVQDSSTIDFANVDGSDTASLAVIASAVKPTECIIIACSDETTAITTGTAKVTFRMPYAFTLSAVRASVTTAPTGSTIIIDINESGSTILSTKLSIDASEKTSTTAASAAVISDSSLADDAEITIDFDQVGSTIAGAGVKVTLIGART